MLRFEPLADRITPTAVVGTRGDDVFLVYALNSTHAMVETYSSTARGWATASDEIAIDGGGGNDQLWVIGTTPRGVKFTGGAGTDTVRLLSLPSANILDNGSWTDVRPATGAGVSFDAGSVEALTVAGTNAAEVYRVSAGAMRTPMAFDTRGGADSLVIGGLTAATVQSANDVGWVGSLSYVESNLEGLYLLGTEKNDTLTVGTGVTRGVYLSGLGGDDTLYGGAGSDVLVGGAGNDGLFGGRGNNRMWGETGADRFLDWTAGNTLVADADSGDAVIRFTPGTAANRAADATSQDWREDEITTVDKALGNLHRLTGNTKLLKTPTGQAMGFERWAAVSVSGGAVLGWNFGSGVLSFTSNAFTDPIKLWATVYHEFGHNWDDAAENPLVPAFNAISGWTQSLPNGPAGYAANNPPLTEGGQTWFFRDAAFARSYGWQGGPKEDYATTWETVLTQHFHGVLPAFEGRPNVLVPAKAANVWALIDSLR